MLVVYPIIDRVLPPSLVVSRISSISLWLLEISGTVFFFELCLLDGYHHCGCRYYDWKYAASVQTRLSLWWKIMTGSKLSYLRDCVVRHPSISPGYWLPPEEHHKVRRAWVWNFELCFRARKAMKANVEWFSQMNRKWGIKRNARSTEQFDTQNRCFEVSRASTKIY